jgi:hypothetical protein
MDVRRDTAARIDPRLDEQDLRAVLVELAAELESLPEHGILDYVGFGHDAVSFRA